MTAECAQRSEGAQEQKANHVSFERTATADSMLLSFVSSRVNSFFFTRDSKGSDGKQAFLSRRLTQLIT